MTRNRKRTRRIIVVATYVALALFAFAEFHALAPTLFHGAFHGEPGDSAPFDRPGNAGTRQPCALCLLVQTAVLVPAVQCADGPPVTLSDDFSSEYRTILWCDCSWTPETLRGPPSFDTV